MDKQTLERMPEWYRILMKIIEVHEKNGDNQPDKEQEVL